MTLSDFPAPPPWRPLLTAAEALAPRHVVLSSSKLARRVDALLSLEGPFQKRLSGLDPDEFVLSVYRRHGAPSWIRDWVANGNVTVLVRAVKLL